MSLTFERYAQINQERNAEAYPQCADWTINDWIVALTGEVGEAANIAKKIHRGDPPADAEDKLAKELADVVAYCNLLLTKMGRRLDVELTNKFNEISERIGSQYRMTEDGPYKIDADS